MEGKKYSLIIILFLVLFGSNLKGSNKGEIYNAYINNKMLVWKGIIDQLQDTPQKSDTLVLELINYQYGYIGWCIGENRKDEAQKYLKLAEGNLKFLETRKFASSKIAGYKSALYGFRIGLNPFTAPFIGPKSSACAKEAVAVNPEDYFGYNQLGNVQFHAPSLVGGSKSEALNSYLKARALMEKNIPEFQTDWNYLSLLISIAKTYEILDDNTSAKSIYEEILKTEPQFKWVRDELYPQLLKKLN